MVIAVITGGRDRTPTLFELEQLAKIIEIRGVTVLRHGDCRGTDKAAAAWVKARGLAHIEPWSAEDFGTWPACGPRRNRAMLDGAGQTELFGSPLRPRADFLVAFAGGDGTADCRGAAQHRRLEIFDIAPATEPRPWNRHHGEPPGPAIYVGDGTPLGNPWRNWRAELRDGETRADVAQRVLEKYRRWLWERINGGAKHDAAVVAALEEFSPNHYAVCSCWPNHCHAEVVIRAWRWLRRR